MAALIIMRFIRRFAAAGVSALMLLAPVQAGHPFALEWRELSPGVWAGIRPVSYNTPVVGSTVIVIGKRGVLVFDPAGFALQGERLVEKLSELTALPLTHIVISHWHGDHSLGAHAVLKKFPNAMVISHEFTAEVFPSPLMGDVSPPSAEAREAARGRIRQALETGQRADGTPLSDSMRTYFAYTLEHFDLVSAEAARLKIAAPDFVMSDRHVIDLGGRKVELLHLGRGNTKGDVVMRLRKERILASGDIIVRPTPYGFGSYPRDWADVLRRVKALKPRIIIPGHGDILAGDDPYIDLLIETLESVAGQTEALVAEGRTLDEARELVDFSAVEPRFTGGDPLLTMFFNAWFKQPIVKAAYNLATGVENEDPNVPLTP